MKSEREVFRGELLNAKERDAVRDGFNVILELTQEEKRELLNMWKKRQYEKI